MPPVSTNDAKKKTFSLFSDAPMFSPEAVAHLSDAEFARYAGFINTMVAAMAPVGPQEERTARFVAELMFRIVETENDQMVLMCLPADSEAAKRVLKRFPGKKNLLNALSRHASFLARQYGATHDRLLEMQQKRREAAKA